MLPEMLNNFFFMIYTLIVAVSFILVNVLKSMKVPLPVFLIDGTIDKEAS
jgi:hypothetical protein